MWPSGLPAVAFHVTTCVPEMAPALLMLTAFQPSPSVSNVLTAMASARAEGASVSIRSRHAAGSRSDGVAAARLRLGRAAGRAVSVRARLKGALWCVRYIFFRSFRRGAPARARQEVKEVD